MKDKTVIENANKITYLIQQYPDLPFAPQKNDPAAPTILAMIPLAPIDTNVAVWSAIEFGWLKQVGEGEDRHPELDTPPAANEWVFGATVAELEDKILYALEQVAKNEGDVHDYFFSQWIGNYNHDAFIAMKHLIEQKKVAEYMIEDGNSEYVFYTLYKNRDKLWGRKQFKTDPLDPKANASNVEKTPEEGAENEE